MRVCCFCDSTCAWRRSVPGRCFNFSMCHWWFMSGHMQAKTSYVGGKTQNACQTPGSGTQKSSGNCKKITHTWNLPDHEVFHHLLKQTREFRCLPLKCFIHVLVVSCNVVHVVTQNLIFPRVFWSCTYLILCPLGTNARYFHCFCDEDSMGWAKKVCRKMSRRHMELGICKAANLRLLSLRWRSFALNRQSMARRWKRKIWAWFSVINRDRVRLW